MRLLKYTLIFFSIVCFASCSKSNKTEIDSTKPDVILISPTASKSINPGDVLSLEAQLSDNIKLKSYVVKVASTGVKQTKNIVDFSFNSLSDLDAYGKALPMLEGKDKVKLEFDILIPERASYGAYTLSISVFDQSNNQTNVSVEFNVSKP